VNTITDGDRMKPGKTEIRRAFGHFATGVSVVTARAESGVRVAMTVSSFAGVSLDPPLLLWCAQRDIGPYAAFAAADHFAVHVLHAGQRETAMHFARDIADKFSGLETVRGIADLPLLSDYAACFQCGMEHRIDGGDHLILMGRVLAVDCRDAQPLVFHGGRLGGFVPA
jgi:flavin reductase (DIM6/NTAB) family NADH-FMN oxidoreductase RutF